MYEPDLWPIDVPVAERGGPRFAPLVAATRLVQDQVAGARAPQEVLAQATAALASVAQLLESYQGGPLEAVAGTRFDLPGRGHPFLPPFVADEWTDERACGTVTLSRHHDSGGGTAHGGALPLLFVEVLGRLANSRRPNARTAYLHTNFRAVTPIGPELRLEAVVERIEGRKRFVTGRLSHGEQLIADADALFVEPRTA